MQDVVAQFRAAIPGVTVRTTVLVGFPGETEAAFEQPAGVRGGGALRPAGRLHLLGRGGHAPPAYRGQIRSRAGRRALGAGAGSAGRLAWERAAEARRHRARRAGGRAQRGPRVPLGGPHGRPGAGDRRRGLPARPRRLHARAASRACASSRSTATSSSASAPSLGRSHRLAVAIATLGGAGYAPVAPGTVGQRRSPPPSSGSCRSPRWPSPGSRCVVTVVGTWAADEAERGARPQGSRGDRRWTRWPG